MNVGRVVLAIAMTIVGVLQLVPGAGVGEVRAAYVTVVRTCTSAAACDQGEAYAQCIAAQEKVKAYTPKNGLGNPDVAAGDECALAGGNSRYRFSYKGTSNEGPALVDFFFHACVAPAVWDAAGHTCYSSQKCLDKNDDAPKSNAIAFDGSACVEGCEYKPISANSITVGSGVIRQGQIGFTGNACGAAPPPPSGFAYKVAPKQACVPAGAGQSVCIKPDGQHCYSGPIGRAMQFCWRPGETGQKSSGDVAQVRGPGTAVPPATPPASGDTMTAIDDAIESISNLVSGATVGTTVQNYTTGSGTDAGDVDQGEPADGSGSSSGGDGDDDQGSASGGAGCEEPPICTGDPVNCGVLDQVWRNRCSANGHAIAGGDCSEDGTVAAFTCSGDAVMCEQALIAREQQCKAQGKDDAIALDAGEGDGEDDGFQLSDLWSHAPGQELDGNALQLEGGQLFEDVEFAPGQVFTQTTAFDDLLAKIRFLVVAAFMIAAAFLAGGA